ncbi:hypothetical protein [Vibrio paucivorans]|uniref:Cytochrome oxidase biogenesis cluster protein n=1 Tax=Vibrio paucivorans TaxID=2829489 RepID=A0A9X3CB32_9VIBR|nr:hypothetical protein [Vibrio paucivorans]MCW8332392.1 hypothetical protein [Vibrio paucivorans]
MNQKLRGRLLLLGLVFTFAMPALIAKLVLSNHWYQEGVTNKGTLLEPSVSYQSLGVNNPLDKKSWQLAYLVPDNCDDFCVQQLYLLGQSHLALGKYQTRVTPVILLSEKSDTTIIKDYEFQVITINESFNEQVKASEYVIVDPLGQLVMRYPKVDAEQALVPQSKGLLADLRKLLKLSRVG